MTGYYDRCCKKIFLSVYLFWSFRIWSGYLSLEKGKAVFHYSDKKAKILRFQSPEAIRKQFDTTKGIELYGIELYTEYGSENHLAVPFAAGMIQKIILDIVFSVMKAKRDFMALKSNTLLVEDDTRLKVAVKMTLLLNLLTIVMILIKKGMEKLIYAGKGIQRKQN